MKIGYYITRDGKFLGAMGWLPGRTMALVFETDTAARAAIEDMRGVYRRLMSGSVTVAAHEIEQPMVYGQAVHVAYDPFKVSA